MSQITAAITDIKTAAEQRGIAALARDAGVPDRTARDLAEKGFRTKAINTIERLHAAAVSPAAVVR